MRRLVHRMNRIEARLRPPAIEVSTTEVVFIDNEGNWTQGFAVTLGGGDSQGHKPDAESTT